MKRYMIFILYLMAVVSIVHGQSSDSRNKEARRALPKMEDYFMIIHAGIDTYSSTNIYGEATNDVVYTFSVKDHSVLFMANAMGSELEASMMYLLYKPFNSNQPAKRIDASYDSGSRLREVIADERKFGIKYEEDLTKISRYCPLMYRTLVPGEYELYCEGAGKNGLICTNMYFSYVGGTPYNAVDLGNFYNGKHITARPGTFGKTTVYYKFNLDNISMVNIIHDGPLVTRPVITLNSLGISVNSGVYPLKDDSVPQIKDIKLKAGEHVLYVTYEGDTCAQAGLEVMSIQDDTGSSWEKPYEMGSYKDSLHYTHMYPPNSFSDNEGGYAFHRFEIKDTMDISIEVPIWKKSNYGSGTINLHDISHRIIRKTTCREEYIQSLDIESLLPGTYYITTSGGPTILTLNVKGKKASQHLNNKENYITTMKANVGGLSVVNMYNPQNATRTIQNIDAFGRIAQTVQYGITPDKRNLVSRMEYDRMYRDSCAWLPVVDRGAGNILSVQQIRSNALELYNDGYAYEESVYDGSPLNRLVEKYNPGSSWHTTGHNEKTGYLTNTSDMGCLMFAVTGKKDSLQLVPKGYYAAGELIVSEKIDEDGHLTYTYMNKLNQEILSRSINGTDTLDTYQVYDDFGNLCFVLPPLAVDGIRSLGLAKVLDLYAYQYHYDWLNQCSGKKMPGTDWIDLVYDNKSRLYVTRDAEMRKRNEWKCFFYDRLGRKVLTAILKSGEKPLPYYMCVEFKPNATNTFYGYAIDRYNLSNLEMQEVVYYDTYDYKKMKSQFSPSLDYVEDTQYGKRYGDDTEQLVCKGQKTGIISRVLGTEQMLYTSTYYDYYQRPVQTRSIDINGKLHIEKFKYDFNGNILASCENIDQNSLTQSKTYDHAGRLLRNIHQINHSVSASFSYAYDELGRLVGITRDNGGNPLTTTNQYNIRNWLTSVQSPLFSQNLYYTDGTGTPCYNGNISSMTWKAGNEKVTRGYRFEYDPLSRLKNAAYGEGELLALKPDHYDEQITGYDKNGNMLGLKRYGPISANGYGLIDNLSVTLDGNQLVSVNDAATVSAFNNGFDFKDGSKQATEYFYDDNGSLIKDLNKKNTNIQYNCLHLPDRVEFEDGSSISYLYDAAGIKLRVVHSTAGKTTTTDYCGSVIYENGNPKTILTEAGFVSLNDNKYHYYLQDHQGNNRVVADQNGNVEEINHYYPFGGIFANTSSNQPYKYNGKEWDKEYGLNWYDYGARMYDPALGRWHVVDPSSEKYYGVTPYAYCNNNPIKNIDLDGRDWYLYEATGQLYYNKDMNQNQITFNDNLYTWVGANDMLGDMKDITERSYGYKESLGLAQAHGYAINPIQYIKSEDSREQPYPMGPNKSVTLTTGKIEIVNEKYGLFSTNKKKIAGVKTETLKNKSDHIIYDIASTLLTGGKETHYIERNYITYKESKLDDKFYNAVGALYGVANTVTVGKHDYRNVHIYNNWNDYSQSTKGQGGLLKYKK